MKILLLSLFSFCFFIRSFAQPFFKELENEVASFKYDAMAFEMENNNIAVYQNINYSLPYARISLYSANGTLLNTIKIDSVLNICCKPMPGNKIMAIGFTFVNNTRYGNNLVAKVFDADLNCISSDLYEIPYPVVSTFKVMDNGNGFGFYSKFHTKEWIQGKFEYQIGMAGRVSYDGKFQHVDHFPMPELSLEMFTNANKDYVFLGAHNNFLIYDSLMIHYKDILCEMNMTLVYKTYWDEDSILIISGYDYFEYDPLNPQVGGNYKLVLARFDKNYQFVDSKIMDNSYENTISGRYSCFSETDNNYFIVGTGNGAHYMNQVHLDSSYIYVQKLDKNLKKVWETSVGGDAYYDVYSVCATQDKGCIVLSSKVIPPDSTGYNSLVLVRFDKNGSYTEVRLQTIEHNAIHLYPNPGNRQVWLSIQETNKPAQVKLYNSMGVLVCTQNVYKNEAIDLSFLNTGCYFYRTFQNGLEIGNGKWIKE